MAGATARRPKSIRGRSGCAASARIAAVIVSVDGGLHRQELDVLHRPDECVDLGLARDHPAPPGVVARRLAALVLDLGRHRGVRGEGRPGPRRRWLVGSPLPTPRPPPPSAATGLAVSRASRRGTFTIPYPVTIIHAEIGIVPARLGAPGRIRTRGRGLEVRCSVRAELRRRWCEPMAGRADGASNSLRPQNVASTGCGPAGGSPTPAPSMRTAIFRSDCDDDVGSQDRGRRRHPESAAQSCPSRGQRRADRAARRPAAPNR